MSKIRGVNIGNWLVLEKWMKPALFDGLEANDETDFCNVLGEKTLERLKVHRDTFITFEDFMWIAASGINTVRIPIPHWIFGDVKPYFACIEYLDNAMEWAKETGLKVLLDLHTAPGCQNGFDNGGISGVCEWHTKEENIARTVEVIGKIAERYKGHTALWGIQLLNEPRWDVPMDNIRDYYLRGYKACRTHVDENVAIVMHDGFRLMDWKDFMRGSEFKNVMLDTHFYQCFGEDQLKLSVAEHIQFAAIKRAEEIKEMSNYFPLIVGEWSLDFNQLNKDYGLNGLQLDSAVRAYAGAQLLAYENAEGWFFWSYKVDSDEAVYWDYRRCVNNNWFASKLRNG